MLNVVISFKYIYICSVNFKFDQKKISLGLELPLMEAFYTIQGEGFHKGSAAYFIRIGGCHVGCHCCDDK